MAEVEGSWLTTEGGSLLLRQADRKPGLLRYVVTSLPLSAWPTQERYGQPYCARRNGESHQRTARPIQQLFILMTSVTECPGTKCKGCPGTRQVD